MLKAIHAQEDRAAALEKATAVVKRLESMKRSQDHLIDLDSLLRQNEKESIKSEPAAPKPKVKMYEM